MNKWKIKKITWGLISRGRVRGDAASLVLIASYWHSLDHDVYSCDFQRISSLRNLQTSFVQGRCCHHGDLLVQTNLHHKLFPYPSQCRQEPLDPFHSLQEYEEESRGVCLSHLSALALTFSLCHPVLVQSHLAGFSSIIHIRGGLEALFHSWNTTLEFLLGRLRSQYKVYFFTLPLSLYLLSALK